MSNSLNKLAGCEGVGDGPLPCELPRLPAELVFVMEVVPLLTCDAPELDEAAVEPPPVALRADCNH